MGGAALVPAGSGGWLGEEVWAVEVEEAWQGVGVMTVPAEIGLDISAGQRDRRGEISRWRALLPSTQIIQVHLATLREVTGQTSQAAAGTRLAVPGPPAAGIRGGRQGG